MPKIKKRPFNMCRLCLNKTPVFFSLIDSADLSSQLEALTSLKIEQDDSISTVICTKCRLNLNLAYKIQQNMLNAEKRFYETCIKQETIILVEEQEDPEPVPVQTEGEENVVEVANVTQADKIASCIVQKVRDELKVLTEKRFVCDLCGKECPTKHNLSVHKKNHQREKCKICSKVITKCNMRVHIDMHEAIPHVCELCGATLKTVHNLRQHMFYSHHESRFKCSYCSKAFKKKFQCRIHENKEHVGDPNLVCDQCGKKFYSSRTLSAHVKMKHMGLRPYECEFCHKKFCSSHAMKTHRRQHTNETPYKCPHCDLGFRQNVSLKSHLKSKHGVEEEKNVECPVCNRKFASKVALYTHQRLH